MSSKIRVCQFWHYQFWHYAKYGLVVSLFLFSSVRVFAWSQEIHTRLGEASFQQLSKKERRYYAKLVKHLPSQNRIQSTQAKKYKKKFRDMSAWVDSVRETPIKELFSGDVPQALTRFQNYHSSRWHYQNNYYYLASTRQNKCRLRDTGMLLDALKSIDLALTQKPTVQQEAILVAFALHLIEDAHQPLHAVSAVRSDCTHDRGGNAYCLKKYAGNCMLNLHQLWDRAFSIAREQTFWSGIHYSADKARPIALHLSAKQVQSKAMAEKIYALEENRTPGSTYRAWAQSVVKGRLREGVIQTTAFLKAHYQDNQ